MIKVIIFDCFGVLVESSYSRFFAERLADQPDTVRQISLLSESAGRAEITPDDFFREVASLTGLTEAEVRQHLSDHPPNLELLSYIRDKLKSNYKIGLLSNVSSNRIDELFTPDQVELFDDIVLSYAVKMTKPDPAIYRLSAENLGVSPGECVFVDDGVRYVEGAESTGMQGIVYQDFTEFRHQLDSLLTSAN